jgi:hypothetical protein
LVVAHPVLPDLELVFDNLNLDAFGHPFICFDLRPAKAAGGRQPKHHPISVRQLRVAPQVPPGGVVDRSRVAVVLHRRAQQDRLVVGDQAAFPQEAIKAPQDGDVSSACRR